MKNHRWSGNVRELRNVVIQLSMVAEGTEIKPTDLPAEIAFGTSIIETPASAPESSPAAAPPNVSDLEEIEKQTILRTLAKTGGRRGWQQNSWDFSSYPEPQAQAVQLESA